MNKKVWAELSQMGIVPVIRIDEVEDSIPLATALYEGGIHCAEVTFRSQHAPQAIKLICEQMPNMLVGAGTVLTTIQAKEAKDAGAKFIITPGFNKEVVEWCLQEDMIIIPGVSSASEIELALSYGLTNVKFFPAQSSGGAQKIKDLSAPYPMLSFIPTGGIGVHNMHEYLSLPNVAAIGGSFMLPNDAIVKKDWDTIRKCSEQAIASMLSYQVLHVGIHVDNQDESLNIAKLLCSMFHFQLYEKPKSNFAGVGFEVMHKKGTADKGHVGIYTPYPERALYQLKSMGIHAKEDSITRNKKTKLINFVYLDIEIAGFQIHLINPDVKM